MQTDVPVIDETGIRKYLIYLKEQERSEATLQKYSHDLHSLLGVLKDVTLTKAALIAWKHWVKLLEKT